MKKSSVLILLLSFCFFSMAQVLDGGDPQVQAAFNNSQVEGSPLANFWQKRTPMMDILFALVKDDDGITRTYVGAEQGSAYKNETFAPGKVYYNDDELGDVFYRYNAYNNEIEIKKTMADEERQLALVKNEEVRLITPIEEFQYLRYIDEKENTFEGYLILLKKGNIYNLYKRIFKKFTPPKAAENSMVNSTPSRFTDYTEYYFKEKHSKTVRELRLHKKRTASSFPPDIQSDIQNYIKLNKPDANSEADVLAFFNFIDNR